MGRCGSWGRRWCGNSFGARRFGARVRGRPPLVRRHHENHLIVPSIREIDGEERFKIIGFVDGKLFTGVFVWRDELPRFISVRRSNDGEEKALPADPTDAADFDATAEALDRGQRARLIRTTRTAPGLSQTEFAGRFRVPVGTLRDWEQARVSPPDFAVAYVKVIGKYPEMVAKAVA